MYFVQGSALSLFDLERANFRQAATILVSQLGSVVAHLEIMLTRVIMQTRPSGSAQDPYMVDAEAIFTVRLIESHLPKVNISLLRPISCGQGSETIVVVELVFDENYHYLPHPADITGRRPSGDVGRRSTSSSADSVKSHDRRVSH